MANNKNLESIDEIFRKTFNELPETPAANGWDAPSDHVWQQVQTGIQTRHHTWSNAAKIMGLISISVAVAAGIYFLTLTDAPAIDPSAPSMTPVTAPVAVTAPTGKVATLPVSAEKPVRKITVPTVAPKSVVNTPATDTKIMDQPIKTSVAKPNHAPEQPAEKSAVPNVVERRKQVERIKSTWGKFLNTIPAQRKATTVPAVPSELKHLAPNKE